MKATVRNLCKPISSAEMGKQIMPSAGRNVGLQGPWGTIVESVD